MPYVYFKENEINGLEKYLVEMLDNAREYAGVPFIITSGKRTDAESIAVGGFAGDPHTKGLAVDLRCQDSHTRFKIIGALLQAGFKRIGDEIDHIHADIDNKEPMEVIFRK